MEASVALNAACSTANCAESFRIAVRDDNRVILAGNLGLFESGGLIPGVGGRRGGVGGKTTYRAQLAACKGGNSFVPGTLVLMADGLTKPIEAIELGDLVSATDPASGETAPRAVTDLITGKGIKDLAEIVVTGGEGRSSTARIVATTSIRSGHRTGRPGSTRKTSVKATYYGLRPANTHTSRRSAPGPNPSASTTSPSTALTRTM